MRTTALLALLLLLAGCGQPAAEAPRAALPVTVVKVALAEVPQSAVASAQLEGVREVEVRARVTGILQTVDYREGGSVHAGDLLFRIDPAPYAAALDLAKAQLRQEAARAAQTRADAGRLARLLAAKAAGPKEAEDAETAALAAEASRDAAAAKVRLAELDLGYCEVRSPIDGVAGRRLRTEGALVTPVGPDGLLTTVVQCSELWARFGLSESEFGRLFAGRADAAAGSAVVLLGPSGQVLAEGKVDFAAPEVDGRLGNVQFRARFANPAGALLPGQFVRVRVAGRPVAGGCLVPQSALVQLPAGRAVMVAGEGDRAEPRIVVLGEVTGDRIAVLSGLREGDRVVLDQLQKVRPGATLAPREAPAK